MRRTSHARWRALFTRPNALIVNSRYTAFQQYAVLQNAKAYRVLEKKENLPWSTYIGVCGMPGQTAYHGWKEFSSPKKVHVASCAARSEPLTMLVKGDVVFVSTAAGPVGAYVPSNSRIAWVEAQNVVF